MKPGDLLIVLGLNSRVAALPRKDGRILWTTDLPGIMGDRFVTVTCDDTRVYAYTRGQVHCLDLDSGRVLWSNQLKGSSYGIATICVPGSSIEAAPAAQAKAEANRRTRD